VKALVGISFKHGIVDCNYNFQFILTPGSLLCGTAQKENELNEYIYFIRKEILVVT
jgi:hypothetical protein